MNKEISEEILDLTQIKYFYSKNNSQRLTIEGQIKLEKHLETELMKMKEL